jgi:hypothetical protein
MFGPSLKSVPGCLVSIVPIGIGVPVAFTPGLGPQDEVLLELAVAAVVPLVELELAVALAPLELVLLELLLPHAASSAAPTTTASAMSARMRSAR